MPDQGSEASWRATDFAAGRFEPAPMPRPRWEASLAGSANAEDPFTPERWLEQPPLGADSGSTPSPEGSGPPRNPGRRFAVALAVICIGSSMLAAGGTYAVVTAAGTSGGAATPSGGVGIVSDGSAIVAAAARVGAATVQIVADDGQGNTSVGAGIIFDVRGWILTNKHVVVDAKTLTVRLSDDRRVSATTYGLDTLTDLAIVRMTGVTDISAAPLGDSSAVQVGQVAIAIGSPLGLAYPNTVTRGIVSALGRDITVAGDSPSTVGTTTNLHSLIQTDAAINPGNSGGPLVDADGKVIGITTASAQTATGIGFAIPIDTAKPIMQQALAGEKLSRPFIGVTYSAITKGLAALDNLPLQQGAWVHKEDDSGNAVPAVTSGSPAEAAGIKDGDIIMAVDGQQVDPLHPLEDLLVQYSPGRTITLKVYRDGGYITLDVTLGTRPDNLG